MKSRKLFNILVIFAMMVMLVPVTSVIGAPAPKVDVCHLDDDGGYILINISENAFDSHVAHGDASPDDWVPGMEGYIFADDCSLVSVPKKEFVATLTVWSTLLGGAKQVAFSPALALGQEYELVASGLYNYGNAEMNADAKCSYRPANIPPFYVAGWYDGATLNTNPALAYGLQVTMYDGNTDKPLAPVGWVEDCNLAHEYTATYVGTGNQLGLFIWDDVYTDNEGSITVNIYKVNW